NRLMRISVLSALSLALIGALTKPALADIILVDPANTDGWTFANGSGSGGVGSLSPGPGTPPLGTGSAYLAVSGSSNAFDLYNTLYMGTPLSSISGLNYSTYVINSGSNTDLTPALQFGVASSPSTTSIFQGELVF